MWKALRQRCVRSRCATLRQGEKHPSANITIVAREKASPEKRLTVVSSAPSTHWRRHFVVCAAAFQSVFHLLFGTASCVNTWGRGAFEGKGALYKNLRKICPLWFCTAARTKWNESKETPPGWEHRRGAALRQPRFPHFCYCWVCVYVRVCVCIKKGGVSKEASLSRAHTLCTVPPTAAAALRAAPR